MTRSSIIFEFVKANGIVIIPATKDKTAQLNYANASARIENIITWFDGDKSRAVGVPCGKINGIIAVDCDIKDGGDGINHFHEICKLHDAQPSPVYQDTPSGGRQYFYKYDPRVTTNTVKWKFNGEQKDIDIRTDAGYVIMDPEGKTYKLHGNIQEAPTMPDWLAEALSRKETPKVLGDSWLSVAINDLQRAATGERNKRLNNIAFWCARHTSHDPSMRGDIEKALVAAAIELGLDSGEVHRTVKSGLDGGYKKGPFKDARDIPGFLKKIEKAETQGSDPDDDDGDTLHRLPPPPMEIFPEEIRLVIEKVSETKCIPVEMTLAIVLALASACVGRGRGIAHRQDWREHANLFMILIAESGSGKSHAFKYIFKELLKIEAEHKAKYKIEYRQYLEDMAAHRKSKDPDKKLPARPINIQYLLDDSTMEAASERMEDNPKGLFWSIDEMSGFFPSLDKYNRAGNDGKRRLLSAWNAETWNTSRKSKDGMLEERYIAKGAMGLFGGIQPHLLNSLFTYDDVKQGFPQRFIYIRAVVDKPMRMDTPEIPKEVDAILERITRRMIGLEMIIDQFGSSQAKYLTFEPDARAEIVHFGDLVTMRSFGTETYTYAVKMNQMLLRLALILHILEWASSPSDGECPDVISYSTTYKAIKLANWLMSHTERVRLFLPGGEGKKAKRETMAVEHAVSTVLLKHGNDILEAQGAVPNKAIKDWLAAEGYNYTAPAINAAFEALGASNIRERDSEGKQFRGKMITAKVLNKCRKMSVVAPTLLNPGTEDGDDNEE